ncbi:MAG: hypothetical protein ACLT98_14695 [Eggerthellaceae bacterium]
MRPSFAARVNAASASRTTRRSAALSGRASLRRRSEVAQQDAAECPLRRTRRARVRLTARGVTVDHLGVKAAR